jgi:Domain of unknown function (DUF4124)
MRRISVTALLLAGAFNIAQADVYRWVDDKGEPHYSDQWVPGSEVIKTGKVHPPGTDTASRYNDQKTLTAFDKGVDTQLRQEANAKAVQQDLVAKRAANCKQATAAYNQAITARVVYKDSKDGDRTYLSEADADKYREQVRQAVQDNCGSVPKFDPEAPLNPQPQVLVPQPQPIPEPKVNTAAATSE